MAKAATTNPFGERLVRNLRDMQLDDELDFPDIDAQTFDTKDSVHNQAQRIRKAEWVFFNLLQLWDAAAAKDLVELYPAYEPKQSLDLRALIFQHLNGLKKAGILPKELILRKTMFDECKGPKFEELLAAFSTSVLLKLLDRDVKDKSLLKGLLLNESGHDAAELQALETVYRSSLSNMLHERNNLRRRWQRFGRVLKVKEDEIKQRRREHELKLEETRIPRIPQRRMDRLQAHIERDWATSSEWRSILVKSDQHLPDKSLLERPYDEVWKHASEDSLYHFRPEKTRSALQRLEYHVDKQNERLAKWRDAHKLLTQTVSPSPPSSSQARGRSAERTGSPELGTTRYEEHRAHRGDQQPQDASSPTSPPRPVTAKRSNHQSQLTLVTADFEKLGLRGSSSSASPQPAVTPEKRGPSTRKSDKSHRRRSNTVIYSPQVSLGGRSPGMGAVHEDQGDYFANADAESSGSLEMADDAADIINSVLHAEPSPSKKPTLSLTERARMSMAPAPERARSSSPAKQQDVVSKVRERPLSLALDERTRQNMEIIAAGMAQQGYAQGQTTERPSTARRVTVTKRSSRSPDKEKRAMMVRGETPELPEHVDESFLAADVDEDTIFMSRPRIAHSPPLNPVAEADVIRVPVDFGDTESVEDFS